MASGLAMRRINRPDTWLHRPAQLTQESPCHTGAVHTWPKAVPEHVQHSSVIIERTAETKRTSYARTVQRGKI